VALEDIKSVEHERGFPVVKYIESRTVIEDTESSIDLIRKGWTLYNYPDRLAYSATPPDFGSLVIQRRRWANGGLLILPKLIGYLLQRPFRLRKLPEFFMRAHYLISIAAASGGVLLLLVYPFEEIVWSPWLPLTALPYFTLYGRDLVNVGYRWADLPRVYALNLALIPVNLGGVLASIRQAFWGHKSSFGRTPKVQGRTAAPAGYILAAVALFAYCLFGSAVDVMNERWMHASFAFFNGLLLGYAMVVLIGLRDSAEDLAVWLNSAVQHATKRFRQKAADTSRVEPIPTSTALPARWSAKQAVRTIR
jgi:cellulose synthase (UDP-forming)